MENIDWVFIEIVAFIFSVAVVISLMYVLTLIAQAIDALNNLLSQIYEVMAKVDRTTWKLEDNE